MPSQKSVGTAITIMLCLVMAVVTMSHVEASDTWSPTGSMSTPRVLPHGHVAARWPGARQRRVYRRPASWRSAEIYDPALGTWSPTGSMSTARYCHTATLLPDGRVLVSGGHNGIRHLASAEIYDPALGTWSPTGSMSTARYCHTATLLPDGRVLVSGGYPTATGSAEIYDPALGTWSLTPSMSTAAAHHTATLLPDGRVLVSGGLSATRSTPRPAPRSTIRRWAPGR